MSAAAGRRWQWLAPLAAAAGLAGIAVIGPGEHGVGYIVAPRSSPGPSMVRAVPSPALSEPTLLAPAEGETVARAGLALRWQGIEGASDYRVTLLDADGNVLFEQNTATTSLTLPEELGLRPGEPTFAWILARMADGRSVRAPAVGFTIQTPTRP